MSELVSINPADGSEIACHAVHDESRVREVLLQAAGAQAGWRSESFERRTECMRALAERLRDDCDRHARLMTEEMGKPISAARKEVEKCAWVCDYYAEHGQDFLAPRPTESDASDSYISFQPLGVVLAVMPWNFPYWQVFRFAAPALMAGNAAVLKHASNVSGCSLAMEELFRQAGFPSGLFSSLLIPGERVEAVIAADEIAAVTLTGSTPAGSAVAAAAGKHIKKSVLELGGSDPYVILADADVTAAARACVQSRLVNTGQSCIAAKRFIVVRDVMDDFREAVLKELHAVNWGDPMLEDTDIGPMAREDLRDELHTQVRDSVSAGATCVMGGEIPDRPGAWYPPTLLTDVQPGVPAFDEELFGPVAVLVEAEDEQAALALANRSEFGLGAAVFTTDIERGRTIAELELQAGFCAVNDFVRSDPRLPFGGIKRSGYGRELGDIGIREFVNIKTVYVA